MQEGSDVLWDRVWIALVILGFFVVPLVLGCIHGILESIFKRKR